MTTKMREYIGSRYVPIFDGEWNNSKNYEPLTIVLYQGNSYTSRQFVPTGIDIANDDYWAITGNYNAQVEQYKQEVTAIGNKLPSTAFTSENTVKNYIDENIESLAEEPLFDVVYSGIDHTISDEPFILIKIPRDKVDFTLEMRDFDDYENTWEYAENITEQALIFNSQLNSAGVSEGIVKKEEDTVAPEYWYIFGIKNGVPTVLADPTHSYTGSQLVTMGFTLAFGVWEILKLNGVTYTMDDFSDFSGTSHYTFIANDNRGPSLGILWDNNYWYVLAFDGRMPCIRGLSRSEMILVMNKYEIPNGVHCDGGGSVQVYLTNPAFCVTRVAHSMQNHQIYNQRRNVLSLCKLQKKN